MSGVEEALASSVLLDLAAEAIDDAHWCESNYTKGCNCREWRERQAGYVLAVVAEQLRPLIRQAQAEAWREGVATALNFAVRNEDGITLSMDLLVAHPNPYRAGDA